MRGRSVWPWKNSSISPSTSVTSSSTSWTKFAQTCPGGSVHTVQLNPRSAHASDTHWVRLRGSRRRWAQLRTEGTQHVPGINAGVVTVTPVDMQGVIAHRSQADGVDILGGDRGHHLEGISWRLLLLASQLATG